MVKFSAAVVGIGPAIRPDGTTAVAIAFGVPVALPKPKEEEGKNVIRIQLPNQQLPGAPINEYRLVLYLSEDEWSKLECKPVYGETFVFEANKAGFTFCRDGK